MLPQGARSIARRRSWRTVITTARKGKTMTKHMTGDSEVERNLRKMKTAPQALTERTMTDIMRDGTNKFGWLQTSATI